ncbi:MAG TPA: iron-containing alcohol dehydrogenase [Aquabacterium sp.]|jgi:alcohol dehydrogenase class IV|nr:MAG: iron-containing alcohol dehydrogenase [Burkholderiaceae bacterium]HOY34153.1 iron-containing alcohol dehydrogenase [Piscinibacter sp.]HPM64610.1 iron-containing alcohol dehydrogenase [Piscinibacter sp.]HQC97010.1 iron-containing alcohol dehydrogenase [Aquabacterium sp.]
MNTLSRLRVATNAAIVPLLSIPTPLTFTGPGASLTLCRVIAGTGARRLLLVTDPSLLELGLVEPMRQALAAEGVHVDVFSDIAPDPDYAMVEAGIERLRTSGAQAVLAVGGGSPLDCAKVINLSHANGCHPSKLTGLWLFALPRKRGLPFYAVPTTAGSGSEVTMAAVVSDHAAQSKRTIVDPKTLPDMVALDPSLTVGLPPSITAPTGMDALTHAVEAYLSTMANAQTDAWALAATTLIARALPKAYADGRDLRAREDMLVGSTLAGMAFTRAGVGYVHALSHQIGAIYHLPHGLVNSIVMPRVLSYYRPECAPRMAALARAAGLATSGQSDAELADALIEWVHAMNAQMGMPQHIQAIQSADFDRIVDNAFAEAHGTYGVPRYLDRGSARTLLQALAPQ